MKNFFRQNKTNIIDDNLFHHDLYNNYLAWIHQQKEKKFKKPIFYYEKQMFAYNNKCFQNNLNLNIENENDCFIIEYSFEKITGGDQNAAEKFKSFTTN